MNLIAALMIASIIEKTTYPANAPEKRTLSRASASNLQCIYQGDLLATGKKQSADGSLVIMTPLLNCQINIARHDYRRMRDYPVIVAELDFSLKVQMMFHHLEKYLSCKGLALYQQIRLQPLPIRTAREVFPQAAHPTSFITRVMSPVVGSSALLIS
jgi:hypothetical protein